MFAIKFFITAFKCLIFLMLFVGCAFASIKLYPISVTTNSQGNAQIKVISSSDKMDFVKVSVKVIDNPGTAEESERELVENENLVITPAKFALAAGSTRIVRLVNISPPAIEQVYRVNFESVDNLEANMDTGNAKTKIGVNVIWGALAIVPPVSPREAMHYASVEHQLVNDGNVHITLKEIGICHSKSDSGDCKWVANGRTIYPGQKLMLKSSVVALIAPENTVKIKYLSSISKTTLELSL